MNNQFQYALNGLIYNESLQKSVVDTMEQVERRISLLMDTLAYMDCIVKTEDDRGGGYITQIIRGENMCRVRKPFFSSNNNLIPFNQETDTRRRKDFSHDFYLLKHQIQKLCSEKQLEILRVSIGKSMYDIEHASLIRSNDKCSDKKLKVLKTSTLGQLSERCNGDMIDKIDWMTISSQDMNGKITHSDCKKLWEKVFNPEYDYSRWSDSDSTLLLELTSEYGTEGKWVQIASNMPTKRQPFVCFKKWLDLTSKVETSKEWNTEEDIQLSETVKWQKEIRPAINWNKVAYGTPNRSAKDCERRWNSLQVPISNRPFSDEEDYEMLLLIKKIGTQEWGDIAHEMDRRTAEQCQQRYCAIVDELHPWSYFEDRRLWLVLRSYFRTLWSKNTHYVEPTSNLNIYKSVIKGFNGRCPLVLRHRYNTLGKWFHLWNQFYNSISVKESMKNWKINTITTLLSDSCEEKSNVISTILKILLRTTFFDRIRNALYLIGSKNPDSDASELIIQCRNGNSKLLNSLVKQSPDKKLLNLLMFIIDLQNGIFIPTKFEDYINRSSLGYKYPLRANNDLRILVGNIRQFETKAAVSSTVENNLSGLLDDENINERDKGYIKKILACEGIFSAALNFAVKRLEKTREFNFSCRVQLFEELLPEIMSLMIGYMHCQDCSQYSSSDLKERHKNAMVNECEELAELLIYRDKIPDMYKTYLDENTSISTMFLPHSLVKSLTSVEALRLSSKNSKKVYETHQIFPQADDEMCEKQNILNIIKNIPILPANKCTLHCLRSLILQKSTLLSSGQTSFEELVRLRYDNPVNYLQKDSNFDTPLTIDQSSILLNDPKYILLRTRMLSILSIPSLIARIPTFASVFKGDKLHEEQNNFICSTKISECFSDSKWHNEDDLQRWSDTIKRKYDEVDDIDIICPKKRCKSILKVNQGQHITRRVSQKWLSLTTPGIQQTFFVSKSILQKFIKNDFTIESINGIKSEDFLI